MHRQRTHARRRHRRATRAAGGDDAAEVAAGLDERLERECHRGGGDAAVACEYCCFTVRVVARYLAWMHAGGRGLAGGREVDCHDAHAEPIENLANEEQFAALRVERADHVGGAHAARGDREVEDLRRDRSRASRWRRGWRCRWRAHDVVDARRRSTRIPAREPTHCVRSDVVHRRRAFAVRAAHRQHLHGRWLAGVHRPSRFFDRLVIAA